MPNKFGSLLSGTMTNTKNTMPRSPELLKTLINKRAISVYLHRTIKNGSTTIH